MTRKKSHLSLNRTKQHKTSSLDANTNPRNKRKFLKSPKSTPRKSPFRSPLYTASPFPKKRKSLSHRALFKETVVTKEQHQTELTCDNDNLSNGDSAEAEWLPSDTYSTGDPSPSDVKNAIQSLIPSVVDNLSSEGRLDLTLLKFCQQVNEETFPLNNIALLLWAEVVKWFDRDSTTTMRYSAQTKQFWKLGWKLFGGKFVNFMSGYKSHGDTVLKMAQRGSYSPASSEINFAVPDVKVLREFDPYAVKGERKPGIYADIITKLSENLHGQSACLTYDGKKLKQCLTTDSGDVNLLGFEKDGITERRAELASKTRKVNELLNTTEELLLDHDNSSPSMPHDFKEALSINLKENLQNISMSIVDVKEIRRKKEYCKGKLIERGGESDWRKGKFVYAISAIIAFLYDVEQYLQLASRVSDSICECVASLNNCDFVTGDTVNLQTNSKYIDLEHQIGPAENPRFTKQRSTEWHSLRNEAKVTGSTLYGAIGCDGMSKLKTHFEKTVCGIPEPAPSDFVRHAMKHGTVNEPNAVATVVGKVMPVLEPTYVFCEEGCIKVELEDKSTMMVVSPDGSLRKDGDIQTTAVAVEIKCPLNGAHTKFPPRYLLQCLSEIETLGVDYLMYVSWGSDESTVFRVERNQGMFKTAMKIAMTIYNNDKPKKPTKLSDDMKTLKADIVEESKNVKFIGTFKSVKESTDETKFSSKHFGIEDVKTLLQDITRVHNDGYELQRQRATEGIVFLVADLDRSWDKKKLRYSPVAWFPKGYSLTTDMMREIAEEVHTQCHKSGIHIPCQSFDGQWHGIVVRSNEGHPLTIYQLQRDVWSEVEKLSKKDIVTQLSNMNTSPQWQTVHSEEEIDDKGTDMPEKRRRNVIVATNEGIKLPMYRLQKTLSDVTEDSTEPETLQQTTLADIVPKIVYEANEQSQDVLELIDVLDKEEIEAFTSNINDDEWANEVEDIQNSQTSACENQMDIRNDGNPTGESDQNTASLHMQEHCSENVIRLDSEDMEYLIALFQTTEQCNKKNKWDSVNTDDLLDKFSSAEKLKTFLDVELRVIIKYLKKTKHMTGIKESIPKWSKLQALAERLQIEQDLNCLQNNTKGRCVKVKSLKEISVKAVGKYSKQELNVILASHRWTERYSDWKYPTKDITVNGEHNDWFYRPEFSLSRKQYEVRCIDSTHLLTRTRRKSCRGGLDNLPNEAWIKVAKQKQTLLTQVMVEEVTDPMSVSMAKTHFSEAVELAMRTNGDVCSANLCLDIRNWWDSEDSPGIPATERIQLRQSLRKRLLEKMDFSVFPPQRMYARGWPMQLWEGILANIDAKTLLYGLCHNGAYNVRAFSSMIGETFFAELTNNDRRGQGTVTCGEFGQFIGNTIEQVQVRLDPERTFSYCTSRSTVYETVDETSNTAEHQDDCLLCLNGPGLIPTDIVTRNHHFDSKERRRLAGRKHQGTIPTTRNCLQNRALGVRWETARCNLAKMLPTKRMGIPSGLSPVANKQPQ